MGLWNELDRALAGVPIVTTNCDKFLRTFAV